MVGGHPRYGRVGLLVVVFLGKAGTGMRNDPGVNQYARVALGTMRFIIYVGHDRQGVRNDPEVNQATRVALLRTMRFIVPGGSSIYLWGDFFGYRTGAVGDTILDLAYRPPAVGDSRGGKPGICKEVFLRLLLGTVAVLVFGYAGEAKFLNPWLGIALGWPVERSLSS